MEEDGGKIIPRPALPATIVVARSVLHPLCFIHGIVIEPTADALPEPDPETMPNRALAMVDTYPEPPGRRPSTLFKISTSRPITPVLSIINAINTNAMEAYTTSCFAAALIPVWANVNTFCPAKIPPIARMIKNDHIMASAIFLLRTILITRMAAM